MYKQQKDKDLFI